jgi:hypothetical protein
MKINNKKKQSNSNSIILYSNKPKKKLHIHQRFALKKSKVRFFFSIGDARFVCFKLKQEKKVVTNNQITEPFCFFGKSNRQSEEQLCLKQKKL